MMRLPSCAPWLLVCWIAWTGCGFPPPPVDEDPLPEDAGLGMDAGPGGKDAGPEALDAGVEDASTPPPAPPAVSHFQATQASVERGESADLSWEVSGATQVRIEPGLGSVSGSRVTVRPTETTTYTLTAEGAGGKSQAQVTVTVTEPPPPWAPLSAAYEEPDGYKSDVYRWLDSRGVQRTAVLTRNNEMDPGGSRGGMLRRFLYGTGDSGRVSTGTGASGLWNGWGYVVSHAGSGNSQVSRSTDVLGQYRQVFLGRHHALHEFSWDMPFTRTVDSQSTTVPVHVTVQWLFATGRDHPVYAITTELQS